MLTYRDNQEAIALAREALALAEALGLQDLRADTLVTLGTARWNDGDAEGVADIEEGLRIATEHNALSAAQRAYTNLASVAADRGDPRRFQFLVEGKRVATRLGARERERFIEAQLIVVRARQGAWDEALRLATDFIAECEHGSPHRQEQRLHIVRARIYYARDDLDAAWTECEKALSLARATHDPQSIATALTSVAEIYAQAGRVDEAKTLVEETMSDTAAASEMSVSLAWVADWIGLDKRKLEPLLDRLPHKFWRQLGELMLNREFARVADIVDKMGAKDIEADARIRAAEALLERKQPDDAAAQVEQALVFFRSVGATRYIREAKQLRAAITREQQEAAQPHV
jgi:tetratricopeptide (TPR) repeat protein